MRCGPPGGFCWSRRRRSPVDSQVEIAARIAGSDAIYSLLAPIKRLCGLDAPIPYAPELEKASVPQIDDITTAARDLVRTS